MATVDDGSEECVEKAFRKVVGNALALYSLLACGSDEEEERGYKQGRRGEKWISEGTSVFESVCSLSILQNNERSLFFSTFSFFPL